jgi:hypothetical protein
MFPAPPAGGEKTLTAAFPREKDVDFSRRKI